MKELLEIEELIFALVKLVAIVILFGLPVLLYYKAYELKTALANEIRKTEKQGVLIHTLSEELDTRDKAIARTADKAVQSQKRFEKCIVDREKLYTELGWQAVIIQQLQRSK